MRVKIEQINGQRKINPHPALTGPPPDPSCEVFVGKVPRDVFEDQIYPVFNEIGPIYEMRLMMDFSGSNRGYCFVMYTNKQDADNAILKLNNYEIKKGHKIGVLASVNNCRLHITHLHKDLNTENFIRKIYGLSEGVKNIAVYRFINTKEAKDASILFNTHIAAALTRRILILARKEFTGESHRNVGIDWAHPNFSPSNVLEQMGVMDEDGKVTIEERVIKSNGIFNESKNYQKKYYRKKYHHNNNNCETRDNHNNYRKKYHQKYRKNQAQKLFNTGQNVIPGTETSPFFDFNNQIKVYDDDSTENRDLSEMLENLPNFIENISIDQQDYRETPVLVNNNFGNNQIDRDFIVFNQNFIDSAGPSIGHQVPNESRDNKTMEFVNCTGGNFPVMSDGNSPMFVPMVPGVNFHGIPWMQPVDDSSAAIPLANSQSFDSEQTQHFHAGNNYQRIPRRITSRSSY